MKNRIIFLKTLFTGCCTLLANQFGIIGPAMLLFIFLMAIDYISGINSGCTDRKSGSAKLWFPALCYNIFLRKRSKCSLFFYKYQLILFCYSSHSAYCPDALKLLFLQLAIMMS